MKTEQLEGVFEWIYSKVKYAFKYNNQVFETIGSNFILEYYCESCVY